MRWVEDHAIERMCSVRSGTHRHTSHDTHGMHSPGAARLAVRLYRDCGGGSWRCRIIFVGTQTAFAKPDDRCCYHLLSELIKP